MLSTMSFLILLAVSPIAYAQSGFGAVARAVGELVDASSSQDVKAAGKLEVGFSPNGGGEALVLRVIDSAQRELKVMAYSFTSAKVTSALLKATRRGVKVYLVADQKHNLGEGASRNARAAFSSLAEAGAEVRVVSAFAIHHDKVILADRKHVQLGSFNFSAAAATKNSENVVVNWDNPDLARVFLSHFERNWGLATPFKPAY
ncbi:phospholipase D family protein [Acidovorax sp.]|uniref:phospholipase D family nuclease n=1 Tax=Acidovorax sp. TaxID=1872122 RepID=UPI00391F0A4E